MTCYANTRVKFASLWVVTYNRVLIKRIALFICGKVNCSNVTISACVDVEMGTIGRHNGSAESAIILSRRSKAGICLHISQQRGTIIWCVLEEVKWILKHGLIIASRAGLFLFYLLSTILSLGDQCRVLRRYGTRN